MLLFGDMRVEGIRVSPMRHPNASCRPVDLEHRLEAGSDTTCQAVVHGEFTYAAADVDGDKNGEREDEDEDEDGVGASSGTDIAVAVADGDSDGTGTCEKGLLLPEAFRYCCCCCCSCCC